MKKIIVLSVILTLFIATNGFPQILKVATGEYLPTIGENLKHGGYATHMLTLAFENQGIKLDIKYLPWKRAIIMTQGGQYDLTFWWFWTEEKQQKFYYGDALLESDTYFFHLKSKQFDWKTYDDLKPYKVGLTRGYSYTKELRDMVKTGGIEGEEVTSDLQNFKKLLLERIDIFPMTKREGLYLICKIFPPEQTARITFHPKILVSSNGHTIFPKSQKNSKKLMELYNEGLKTITEQGIVEKYKIKLINGWYEK